MHIHIELVNGIRHRQSQMYFEAPSHPTDPLYYLCRIGNTSARYSCIRMNILCQKCVETALKSKLTYSVTLGRFPRKLTFK